MASQRRDPRIDQFCDQLLAQLRESPTPLTTREVAAGTGVRRIELRPVRGGLTAHVGDTVRGRSIISCEGTDRQGNVVYLVAKPAPVRTIYRDLVALAAPRPRSATEPTVDPVTAEVIRSAMETVCFDRVST